MKRILVAAVCLMIAVIELANAEDSPANKAPTPHKQGNIARAKVPPKRQMVDHAPSPVTGTASNANVGKARVANNSRPSYSDALQRYRHERHDRGWWKRHYTVIVLVGSGYYYWDAGYWCPAWGYDPSLEYYDYDGPIYTYGNLLPDQVIVNVQRALKQLGYYAGGTTGSLGPASRQALANYQADAGLEITGAIDEATVESLGLY